MLKIATTRRPGRLTSPGRKVTTASTPIAHGASSTAAAKNTGTLGSSA